MQGKQIERVYATHGEKKAFGIKAMVNGILCIAYFKGDEIVAYEPWDDFCRQVLNGPYPKYEVSF